MTERAGDHRREPEDTDKMSGADGEWKEWIIVLRVQAQDRYPPTQWAWGTAPCSADATDAQLLAALPEAHCQGDLMKIALAKPSILPKGS